jgi:hypothetical protein
MGRTGQLPEFASDAPRARELVDNRGAGRTDEVAAAPERDRGGRAVGGELGHSRNRGETTSHGRPALRGGS